VLRWRQSRPWLAGLLLGLLTLKPQLGLFFPIMLLAARDWRVIGGAALSTAALVGMTILIWGIAPWAAYLTQGIAVQSTVLSDPGNTVAAVMPTFFINLRSAGLAVQTATWLQAGMSAIAAGLIIWRFRTRPAADDWNANALFLTAAASGTAYLMTYDTLAMTTAVLFACLAGGLGRWLTFGIYFLTLIQIVLGPEGIPGAALLPIAAMFYLAKLASGVDRERRQKHTAEGSVSGAESYASN
jgi:arabinofuranan 3-O-arabinosyltransferase